MKFSNSSDEHLDSLLQESHYFSNHNHDFTDKNQQQWVNFSVATTLETFKYLRKNTGLPDLRKLLTTLGKQRFKYANEVQHVDLNGGNSFGVWRNNDAPTLAGAAAKAERQRKQGQTQLDIQVGFVSTPIYMHQELYKHVQDNLSLTDTLRPQDRVKEPISEMANNILIHFMKRRGITLKSIEVFDTALFEQFIFHKSNQSKTRYALTSFYRITNISPFVIMLEHPHSKISNMLINTLAQPALRTCLEPSSSKETAEKTQLENVAKFAWICFQIMPFRRGSAGIMQMLIAALLLHHGIEPRRYSGVRLDIDALSLSETLFCERFLNDYHQK